MPFLQTPDEESQAMFSPDGHWVAYVSNESGRAEVYVRPFTPPGRAAPAAAGKWQISREGGTAPAWRDDGRELIFRSALGAAVMAVSVEPGASTFTAGIPTALFPTPSVPLTMSADGQTLSRVDAPGPGRAGADHRAGQLGGRREPVGHGGCGHGARGSGVERQRRDAGLVTDADVLQVDVHLSRTREQQIRAASDERIARAQLNQVMGAPLGDAFALERAPMAAVIETTDLAALEAEALAQRPEVKLAALQEQRSTPSPASWLKDWRPTRRCRRLKTWRCDALRFRDFRLSRPPAATPPD